LYYDSAIGALPKDFENYEAIKKRQEVLGEFAKYTEAITWNDSLLCWPRRYRFVAQANRFCTGRTRKTRCLCKKEKAQKLFQRKVLLQAAIAFFNTDNGAIRVDWYFGNPSAVALGQSEFQRIWGVIALEDNWRRSIKTTVLQETNTIA
jgi:hypothetical protein